ncbi:ATP synthase F0 subunit B [Sphingobacteriales bacterium UPWRP_1]|nr:ATP synthase F0 subunit B [Sphingobacteriales bacterium TSM_CSM]PSJ72798.1 ATP synthase F0 subunit B [Sphingobacteriales bacterium UPWRP_1]
MLLLLSSALMTPDLGLIFWTTLLFLALWFIMGKFAWKPLIGALKERESTIENSLRQADKTRQEMAELKSHHEQLLMEAKEERAKIIKEAKEIKDSIVAEAKEKARTEARKIIEDASAEIHNQKMAAITEVKNLIGTTALDLAAQVLGRELNSTKEQESFVNQELNKIKLN